MEKYEIGQIIDSGSFSNIYLVRNKLSDKLFALKKIDKNNTNYINNIHTENKILLEVKKNNFFNSYIELIQDDFNIYFILEYEIGGNLHNLFYNHFDGKLCEKYAKFYCLEIAYALQYLHDNNIIYRDLKLNNILISEKGRVKLCDFNISCYDNKRLTPCGTIDYMSPEMLNTTEYSNKTDIWSYGIILFELINGTTKYTSTQLDINNNYSRRLKNLIKRILVKETERISINDIIKSDWFSDINLVKAKNQTNYLDVPYIPLDCITFNKHKLIFIDRDITTNISNIKYNIIIIDDDYISLQINVKILKKFGIDNIELFDNGYSAIKYIENHSNSIDLIILDIQMPIIDAKGIIILLNNKNIHITIILLTANIIDSKLLDKKNIYGYIEKPLKLIDDHKNLIIGTILQCNSLKYLNNL